MCLSYRLFFIFVFHYTEVLGLFGNDRGAFRTFRSFLVDISGKSDKVALLKKKPLLKQKLPSEEETPF